MLVYLDTDALSHLEGSLRDPVAIAAHVATQGARIIASVHLLEEVLVTKDANTRHRLAGALLALIEQGGEVLAPLQEQFTGGWPAFLRGERMFQPLPAFTRADVLAMLRDARNLPDSVLRDLRDKRDRGVAKWDAMHAEGRPKLQLALASGESLPSAAEWVSRAFETDFARACVVDAVRAPKRERKRAAEYVKWNPIFRAWLEVLMLEIRRHGIMHEVASSKRGPKWPDVNHSAFAPLVDWFVTDDRRFRASLDEHRSVRRDATWRVGSLAEFLSA
ncbi:MAG: hypothetical protein U1E73_05280 [Planctomycetota bacterium]